MYYRIQKDTILIFLFRALHRGMAVVLAISLLGSLVGYVAWTGWTLRVRELVLFLLMNMPVVMGYLLCLFYCQHRIVFDKTHRAIYRKTRWGSQKLLSFDEAGEITISHRFGVTYKMHSRRDRFGSGFSISPPFLFRFNRKKNTQEYDQTVLPAIRSMVGSQAHDSTEQTKQRSVEKGHFTYYRSLGLGHQYQQLPQNRGQQGALLLIMVFLLAFGGWRFYNRFSPRERDFIPVLAPLVGVLGMGTLLTKKVVFDLQDRWVKVFYMGWLYQKARFEDFEQFQIIRTHVNGMYSTTKVQMKFSSGTLFLGAYRKTEGLEDLLVETKFLLQKKTAPSARSEADHFV